jgi:hypothetical protein
MRDPAKMEQILDLMTVDEIQDALRFVEVMERGGNLDRAEADEWGPRIIARQRFLQLDVNTEPRG